MILTRAFCGRQVGREILEKGVRKKERKEGGGGGGEGEKEEDEENKVGEGKTQEKEGKMGEKEEEKKRTLPTFPVFKISPTPTQVICQTCMRVETYGPSYVQQSTNPPIRTPQFVT